MTACPNCGLARSAEALAAAGGVTRPAVPEQKRVSGRSEQTAHVDVAAYDLDHRPAEPAAVTKSWTHHVGPVLRALTAALWFALALAGLAVVLESPTNPPAFMVAFLLVPPIAVGVACLLIRGIVLLPVVIVGIGATFMLGVAAQLDDRPDTAANDAWFYLFLAAIGGLLIRGVWAYIGQWVWLPRTTVPGTPTAPADTSFPTIQHNLTCSSCGAAIFQQWWSRGKQGYECRRCGALTRAASPSNFLKAAAGGAPTQVQLFEWPSEERALAAFERAAPAMAAKGYYPISVVWAENEWGGGLFSLILPLVVRKGGTLTVTYAQRPPLGPTA